MIRKHLAAVAAALVLLATVVLIGAPAHAERVAKNCVWAPSGWETSQVCLTVTYFQPTASQFEITKVKVEGNAIDNTKRIEYGLLLWNDNDQVKWDKNGVLKADNGWDRVYTPTDVRTSSTGSRMTCWGTSYYDSGATALFTTGVWL